MAASSPHQPHRVPSQCLTFTLANQEHALDILRIREIVEFRTLTQVPTPNPWIRGVMNLRGTVVPVIDVGVKFDLAPTAVDSKTCIMIIEVDLSGELTLMGLIVETVARVLDLSPQQLEEPPAFGTRIPAAYLLAAARIDEEIVLLLDIDRILALDELIEVNEAS